MNNQKYAIVLKFFTKQRNGYKHFMGEHELNLSS